MSAVYLETTALLDWLLGQSRGGQVRKTLDAASVVATSELTLTEAERALVRAEHEQLLTGGDGQRLRGLLQRSRNAWMLMTVSEEVLARAGRPFPVEPVRTLDGIHLATALVFTRALPELRLLSFDRRITENALALGLTDRRSI